MNSIDVREDEQQPVRKGKSWISRRQTGRSEGTVHEGFREMRRMPQDGGGGIKAPRTARGKKWSGMKRGSRGWPEQTHSSITA